MSALEARSPLPTLLAAAVEGEELFPLRYGGGDRGGLDLSALLRAVADAIDGQMLSDTEWRAELASWRTAVLTIDFGHRRVGLRSGQDTGS